MVQAWRGKLHCCPDWHCAPDPAGGATKVLDEAVLTVMYTFPPGDVDDTAKLGPKYVVAYAGVAYTATRPISASVVSIRFFMVEVAVYRNCI